MTKPYQFEPLIDRERLQKHLEDVHARRTELKAELEKLNRASEAATAYMDVWEGRPAMPHRRQSKSRAPGRGPRGKRGEIRGFRKEVYDFVVQKPEGFKTGDIQAHFNPPGDKKQVTRVSAALHNLKKQVHLYQPRDGVYAAVVHRPAASPEQTATSDETAVEKQSPEDAAA